MPKTIEQWCEDDAFTKFNGDTVNKPCPNCGEFLSYRLVPEQVLFHFNGDCLGDFCEGACEHPACNRELGHWLESLKTLPLDEDTKKVFGVQDAEQEEKPCHCAWHSCLVGHGDIFYQPAVGVYTNGVTGKQYALCQDWHDQDETEIPDAEWAPFDE